MTTQNTTDPEEIVPVDPDTKAVANAATQTLFRFVSMRNPQLAKKEGNLKFIFRKDEYKGVFDELLKEWKPELQKSKIDFLTEKVKSPDFKFGYIQRTEKAIKEWFGNFYTSSKNLTANGTLPVQEVNELSGIIVDYSNDPEKTEKFFGGLWDSIIYQVITQEDFYVKEILLQILQTIHYTENYNSFSTETDPKKKEEQQKEIATAKAVIPDYLLIDSATDDGEETTSAKYFTVGESEVGGEDYISGDYNNQALKGSEQLSYQSVVEMGKRQNVALATYRKQQLESLKKELLKAQKQYRKNYQKNYDAQYQKYQNGIKPEQENYQERLLEAEAALEEGANKASKDLALKRVEKPNISDFEFDFENEFDYLQKRLSENSLESLSGLIGKMKESEEADSAIKNPDQATIRDEDQEELQVIFPEDEYRNFDEILELVDEKLAESNEEIYQNTEVKKQQYASVGGVLIPVNNNVTEKTEYKNFSAQTIFRSNAWSVLLTFEDKSIYIVNAYENYIANNTVSDNSILLYTNGVYQLFDGVNMLPINSFKNGFPLNVNLHYLMEKNIKEVLH